MRALTEAELKLIAGGTGGQSGITDLGQVTAYGYDDGTQYVDYFVDPDDQWENYGAENGYYGGDSGGGGGPDYHEFLSGLVDNYKEAGEKICELVDEGKFDGHLHLGALFTAIDIGDLSASLLKNTITAAIQDINYYRATDGLHAVQTPSSLINWPTAQIDWNDYGAGTDASAEDVLENFLRSVN